MNFIKCIYNFLGIFAKAYYAVSSLDKGINGFKCTGIYPLDKTVFYKIFGFTYVPEAVTNAPKDVQNSSSLTTDSTDSIEECLLKNILQNDPETYVNQTVIVSQVKSEDISINNLSPSDIVKAEVITVEKLLSANNLDMGAIGLDINMPAKIILVNSVKNTESKDNSNEPKDFISLLNDEISPPQKLHNNTQTNTNSMSSEILTSSPVRMKIAEKRIKKMEKEAEMEESKKNKEIQKIIKQEKLESIAIEKEKSKKEKQEQKEIEKIAKMKKKEEEKMAKVKAKTEKAKLKKEALEREKELKAKEKEAKKRKQVFDKDQKENAKKKAKAKNFHYDQPIDFTKNIFSQIQM